MKKLVHKGKSAIESTRINDWKSSFVPFVLGFVYLWIFLFDFQPTTKTFFISLFSLLTTLGFASFGYIINEWFDIEEDKRAGKLNRFAFLSNRTKYLLLSTSLVLLFFPWYFLPYDYLSFTLIGLELLSFLVYSILPFRLKRFPLLSCILDTMYAYLIPLLLSMHTFSIGVPEKLSQSNVLLLLIPIFLIGFKNILLHQVKDSIKDAFAGRKTMPHILGVEKTDKLLQILFIAEITSFAFVLQSLKAGLLLVSCYLVYVLIKTYIHKSLQINAPFQPFTFFTLSDGFYQIWFPFIVLFLLMLHNSAWLFLVCIHLAIAAFSFQSFFLKGDFSKMIDFITHVFSLLINYLIFYFFLLFGINLKREKVSVWQYISKKRN